MVKINKEYIEKEYNQAIKEYNAALTEDDLDTARRTMKRLEAIAMQDYGFDYADELAMKKNWGNSCRDRRTNHFCPNSKRLIAQSEPETMVSI